jgi:hypothetical protein
MITNAYSIFYIRKKLFDLQRDESNKNLIYYFYLLTQMILIYLVKYILAFQFIIRFKKKKKTCS